MDGQHSLWRGRTALTIAMMKASHGYRKSNKPPAISNAAGKPNTCKTFGQPKGYLP